MVDEAWSALDHPLLAAKLRQWLKKARKANVAVIMATQSLADIAASQIREALSESCPTRIFTANSRARERATAATYAGFGLTEEQIAIISELRPKAEYVFTAPGAWRKFELALSDLELALIGRNRPEDQAAMLRLLVSADGQIAGDRDQPIEAVGNHGSEGVAELREHVHGTLFRFERVQMSSLKFLNSFALGGNILPLHLHGFAVVGSDDVDSDGNGNSSGTQCAGNNGNDLHVYRPH